VNIYNEHLYPVFSDGRCRLNVTGLPSDGALAKKTGRRLFPVLSLTPPKPRSMTTILYQDKDLIAVEKPEGLASIPNMWREKENMLDLLTIELGQKLFTVHRLDKDVSGILLFAKHADSHRWLNKLFFEEKF